MENDKDWKEALEIVAKNEEVPKRRRLKVPLEKICWTFEEDAQLIRMVKMHGDNSWHRMLRVLPQKSEIKCM